MPVMLYHTCLALFYLATEMRTNKNFLCLTIVTYCPHPLVWCLRPSGGNPGTLLSQVMISAEAKCKVILTPIQQKCHNF